MHLLFVGSGAFTFTAFIKFRDYALLNNLINAQIAARLEMVNIINLGCEPKHKVQFMSECLILNYR